MVCFPVHFIKCGFHFIKKEGNWQLFWLTEASNITLTPYAF